jgi:hypothetical protein
MRDSGLKRQVATKRIAADYGGIDLQPIKQLDKKLGETADRSVSK